ncbi:Quinone oxidoreductase [Oopsacas minuta]|uniref:Quinone oxidoreductase n=1 Tax=Oopsacas minuta TaxID=111878 RepID=A0AAV7K9P7_9METZ|nr:Quinone oxidoreductase [Oopsacas minuta]
MKAIRIDSFGGPEVLKLQGSLPVPEIGTRQVLINVHSVSINPVDTYIRSGQYARLPTLPYTPGNDCSGVIEHVGAEVNKFKPGDRVYSLRTITGSYSTHAVCDVEYVNNLPDCLPFNEGACLGTTYYTAYRALILVGKAKPGQLVLVHGASGGVGTACLQLCKQMGIRAVGTAGTPDGEKAALTSGADTVVNHRQDKYVDTLKELSSANGGFDIILENAAHVNLATDLDLVANKGVVIVVGSKGMNSIEMVPRKLMAKECSVTGILFWNISPDELVQSHAAILAGVKIGVLKPVISNLFELGEAGKAHEQLMSGKGAAGQIVLVP